MGTENHFVWQKKVWLQLQGEEAHFLVRPLRSRVFFSKTGFVFFTFVKGPDPVDVNEITSANALQLLLALGHGTFVVKSRERNVGWLKLSFAKLFPFLS
jgi:hypothetical protein